MLHREALVSKRINDKRCSAEGQFNLEGVFSAAVEIVNCIRLKPKQSRKFTQFCYDVMAKQDTVLLHSVVRWLSREKVLVRLLELKDEVWMFLKDNNSSQAELFKNKV